MKSSLKSRLLAECALAPGQPRQKELERIMPAVGFVVAALQTGEYLWTDINSSASFEMRMDSVYKRLTDL